MSFTAPSIGDTVRYHQRRGIGSGPIDADATVTAVNGSKVDLECQGASHAGVEYVDYVDGGAAAAFNYWSYPSSGVGEPGDVGGLGLG